MMNPPRISIVLPTYNGASYVKATIESILAQNGNFELIIVDDRSTDDTNAIVSRFSDARIRHFEETTNLGIFGNLNRCIRHAQGELVQIFSQDDVMAPGYLLAQTDFLDRFPSVGLVYNSVVWIDESGDTIGDQGDDTTPEIIDDRLYLWLASHYGALPASISSVMVRRDVLERAGLFDETFQVAGDLEFYNRVSQFCAIGRNKRALHFVRSHAEMTSARSTSGLKYLREEESLTAWFRSKWTPAEWRQVYRFRSEARGTTHLIWLLRAMARGRLSDVTQGFRQFVKCYSLRQASVFLCRRVLGGHSMPQPYLPPPRWG